jgi:hypothetical protein
MYVLDSLLAQNFGALPFNSMITAAHVLPSITMRFMSDQISRCTFTCPIDRTIHEPCNNVRISFMSNETVMHIHSQRLLMSMAKRFANLYVLLLLL